MENIVYVTKFFEKKDLHHFERGALRIGTLESYGAEEYRKSQGARFDADEGRFTANLSHSTPSVSNIHVPGIEIDALSSATIKNATVGGRVKSHAFCCSVGLYSTSLHRSMICRDPGGYPGNPCLVGFVTFRLDRLLQSISSLCSSQFPELENISDTAWIRHGRVDYGSRSRVEALKSGHRGLSWDPVFVKPKVFRPENEYRIAVTLQDSSEPEIIQGEEVLGAMCMPPQILPYTERDIWLGQMQP